MNKEIQIRTGSALWERASGDDKDAGWTLSVRFLAAIKSVCEANGETVSLEQIEAVLLASEAHGLLSA